MRNRSLPWSKLGAKRKQGFRQPEPGLWMALQLQLCALKLNLDSCVPHVQMSFVYHAEKRENVFPLFALLEPILNNQPNTVALVTYDSATLQSSCNASKFVREILGKGDEVSESKANNKNNVGSTTSRGEKRKRGPQPSARQVLQDVGEDMVKTVRRKSDSLIPNQLQLHLKRARARSLPPRHALCTRNVWKR